MVGTLGKVPNAILPTELFPLRTAVSTANHRRLDSLKSKEFEYLATDSGLRPSMLESLLCKERLVLKLSAQVMLIKNIDEVLVNGLVGKVIGFHRPGEIISRDGFEGTQMQHGLMRHVLLDEDHRPIMRTDTSWDPEAQGVPRFPLVLFEYSSPQLKGDLQSEAVFVQREEFRMEDPEGQLLARRLQL